MLIMPSTKLNSNLSNFIFVLILMIFTGCGSFNSSSLVSSDGIYSSANEKETASSNSRYYENYFKDKANEIGNDFVFSDSITTNSDYITSNQISYSKNSAAWGEIPDSTDYVIDYFSYRNRYFGYGYGYGYGYYGNMYPYYGYGYGYPGYSYHSRRNWMRYGWGFGFYPSFYFDFYPYGMWGSNMPYGYRNGYYSSYGSYANDIYYKNNRSTDSNVSYNDGRRGSSSNVVIYGNGETRNIKGNSKNLNSVSNVTQYNVGRSVTVQDNNTDNINVNNIRTYKDFVKSNNSVTRNRVYNKPEMGVGISGNGRSNPNLTNKVEGRRYYSNPNSNNEVRGSKANSNDWGLGGRNIRTNPGSSTRSYSNPSSSLPSYNNSNSSRSYSSPSSSNRSFSRSSSGSTSNSSSNSNSSVGGSRGSR